ncbi:MAG: hypothetical protein ACI9LE_000934 [Paraglaciecola sp.]|jgi:hypothetical protein
MQTLREMMARSVHLVFKNVKDGLTLNAIRRGVRLLYDLIFAYSSKIKQKMPLGGNVFQRT